VFDHRVGLDPSLRETDSAICFHCQAPLEPEEQKDPRYVEGKSCPYCYVSEEDQRQQMLAQWQSDLHAITHPLPGSVPCENVRPLFIKQDFDGWRLKDLLLRLFPQIEEAEWQRRLTEGRFRHEKGQVVDGEQIVRAGERYEQTMALATEPEVNADIRFLYADHAMIVVRKPAPLPMHPCGRFHRNTMQHIINKIIHPSPRPLHRLDANTAGLVLYARTRPICAKMQLQFQRQTLKKTYLVRVQGQPAWDSYRCEAPISAEADLAGSRVIDEVEGLPACTEFRVVHRYDDQTTLLEANLLTGRTNQIRVHLWHLGFPVCGDATYLLHHQVAATQTIEPSEAPLMLHAWRLSLDHPVTGERLTFEDERPQWAML
jgi:RluA family pseudouridine synthase